MSQRSARHVVHACMTRAVHDVPQHSTRSVRQPWRDSPDCSMYWAPQALCVLRVAVCEVCCGYRWRVHAITGLPASSAGEVRGAVGACRESCVGALVDTLARGAWRRLCRVAGGGRCGPGAVVRRPRCAACGSLQFDTMPQLHGGSAPWLAVRALCRCCLHATAAPPLHCPRCARCGAALSAYTALTFWRTCVPPVNEKHRTQKLPSWAAVSLESGFALLHAACCVLRLTSCCVLCAVGDMVLCCGAHGVARGARAPLCLLRGHSSTPSQHLCKRWGISGPAVSAAHPLHAARRPTAVHACHPCNGQRQHSLTCSILLHPVTHYFVTTVLAAAAAGTMCGLSASPPHRLHHHPTPTTPPSPESVPHRRCCTNACRSPGARRRCHSGHSSATVDHLSHGPSQHEQRRSCTAGPAEPHGTCAAACMDALCVVHLSLKSRLIHVQAWQLPPHTHAPVSAGDGASTARQRALAEH